MITTKKRTFNQHDNEKESFYKFSAHNFPNQTKLNENISTDVCIIGGGLTGISSALNLSNQGLSITIWKQIKLDLVLLVGMAVNRNWNEKRSIFFRKKIWS